MRTNKNEEGRSWDEGLPKWTDEEFASFLESVKKYGVLDPVWIDQHGNVIKGRKRKAAAEKLGLKNIPTNTVHVESDDERFELWLTLTCQRQQLTTTQKRQLIEFVLKRWPQRSNRSLARLLGVSDKTVGEHRKRLEASAEIPQLTTFQCDDGKQRSYRRIYTFSERAGKAAKCFLKNRGEQLPEKELTLFQARKLSKQLSDELKEGKLRRLPAEFTLHHADFRTVDWPELDLIFTDPPYDEKYLPLWEDLGRLAVDKLRPGGMLVAYSGIAHLDRIYPTLRKHFDYLWTCSVNYANQKVTAVTFRGFWCNWRPLLVFCKGKPKEGPELIPDATISKTCDKSVHPHQQPSDAALYYLRQFSRPGAVIADPFMGSGTFGTCVAKLGEGRKYVGSDINRACYVLANQRIADALDGKKAG